MPALIEIVSESDIRALARQNLEAEKLKAVRQALNDDEAAEAIYIDELLRMDEENKAGKHQTDKPGQTERTDSDDKRSNFSAPVLLASLLFLLSMGFVGYSAISV